MTTATSDTLFPMPEPTAPAELTLEQRMAEFTRIAQGKGGLIPVTAAAELLGISRQRVYQLIDKNQLERIHYCGVAFLTGRSIAEWKASDKAAHGRGVKKVGIWKSFVIGAKHGIAVANAVNSD